MTSTARPEKSRFRAARSSTGQWKSPAANSRSTGSTGKARCLDWSDRKSRMADYSFFTQPMSRGQIARWALHEAGADYFHVISYLKDKPAALLKANPMG